MTVSSLRGALALLAVLACALLAPASGWAQNPCVICEPTGEPEPPEVTIEAAQSSYTGLTAVHALEVSILWCGEGLDAGSARVRLNGVDLTGFAWAPGAMGCATSSSARSTGTVTLPPGSHTLSARVCAANGPCGEDVRTFSYTYLTRGIAVTPDEAVAVAVAGAQMNQAFTVHNAGSAAVSVDFAAYCSGAATGCVKPAREVGVAAGSTRTVAVAYTAGAAGSIGDIRLRGTVVGLATTWDEGTVQVSVPTSAGIAAAPEVDLASVNPGLTPTPALCVTLPAGPGASWGCGDLRLAHAAPSVRMMGREFAPVLVYNSGHAHPAPIVEARVRLPAGARSPDSVRVRLEVNGVQVQAKSYAGAEWAGTTSRNVSIGFETELPTGFYPYRLTVTNVYPGGQTLERTVGGTLGVVNRRSSMFGAGWWMAGVEKLVQITGDSVTWVGGDGSMRRYRRVAGTSDPVRFVAAAVSRPDTLLRDANGSYRRLLPGRSEVRFDAVGQHVATASPTNLMTLRYNVHYELLEEVQLWNPYGMMPAHYFQYDQVQEGWRLRRIQRVYNWWGGMNTPEADGLTAIYGLGGNRITDMVYLDATRVGYGYDDPLAPARITRRTDRMGVPTTFAYGAGGRLGQASTAMGASAPPVVHRYEPAETRGWTRSARRTETHYVAPGPESRTVRFALRNALGAPGMIIDPLGLRTEISYDLRFPALAVKVKAPDGRVSTATYDDFARLTMTVDSSRADTVAGIPRSATTRYFYEDPRWIHSPTRIVAPMNEQTLLTYDSVFGVRTSVSDARGALAATIFFHSADGRMVDSVQTPENRARGLRPQRFQYNWLGNLSRSTSPLGYSTDYYKDLLGRDTLIISAIHSTPEAWPRASQQIWYDDMDRVTLTRAWGPQIDFDRLDLNGNGTVDSTPAEELWTRTEYDREGRTTKVSRWAAPDPAGIGVVTTEWRLDELGRVVSEVAPDGHRDLTIRDGEGRTTGYVSRRGHGVTMRYDRNDRLVERITPAVSYSAVTAAETGWRFPLYAPAADGTFSQTVNSAGAGLTIPADTARFTYDAAGRIRTANNRDAQITRTYWPSGLMKTDTLRIRAYAARDFTRNVYGLAYEYDLNGRRTSLRHPLTLTADGVVQQTAWAYDSLGQLVDVRHQNASVGGFEYDLDGRVRVLHAGTRQEMGYDADGRLEWKHDTYGLETRRHDVYGYDGRGKVVRVEAQAHRDSSIHVFSGLGLLAWSRSIDHAGRGSYLAERIHQDALGNARFSQRDARPLSALAEDTNDHSVYLRNRYQEGTGRLVGTEIPATEPPSPVSTITYDPGGNTWLRSSRSLIKTPYTFNLGNGQITRTAQLTEVSAHYYGADDRLRVLDRRTCLFQSGACRTEQPPPADSRSAFEEHRYDALGRRVLLRSVQKTEAHCSINCRSAVTRTVWDGDQVLHEISAPLEYPEADNYVTPFLDPYFWGRWTYVHGGGIDQPLMAIRHEYSDSLPGARSLHPQTNARGQYDHGVGSVCTIITDPGTRLAPPHDPYDFPGDEGPPEQDPGPTEKPHCIEVDWPGKSLWPTMERQSRWYYPNHWSGSLLLHSRDPSGQYYRRNRFYDAGSGRFTQEDPIGIAGGLNVYGYANGDPISYSDPYGLSAEDCCRADLESSRQQHERTAVWAGENPREAFTLLGVGLAAAGGAGAGALGLAMRAGGLHALRAEYVAQVGALAEGGRRMLTSGQSPEQVARALHAGRRALQGEYRALTPRFERAVIYGRNLLRYGDRQGPTIDYLRRQGKSWEDIIASASRSGGKDLGL